jgi:hypothetical protein
MSFLAGISVAMGQTSVETTAAARSRESARSGSQIGQAQTGQVQAADRSTDSSTVPDNPQPAATGRDSFSAEPPLQNKLLTLPRQLLNDQVGMWTSPAKTKLADATWLVPLGGLAAALFVTDSDFSRHLSNAPDTLNRYRHISDYGVYSMAGGDAALYLLGLVTHNEHQRESGFLGGESAIDSLIVTEALSYATRRERPLQDNAKGQFGHGGTSFPSDHAAVAWAIAGTIAHEYPSPFVKFLSYGAASVLALPASPRNNISRPTCWWARLSDTSPVITSTGSITIHP